MSFDLFLVSFRDGEKGPGNAPAAKSVLGRFKFQHDPKFDCYDIDFDDGSHVEMFAGGLDDVGTDFDGGMIALRGMSDAIGAFIFEFSREAGCVVFAPIRPASVLLPRDDLAAHLPASVQQDFQLIPIASGQEILKVLDGGYEAWRAYRDQIVRGPKP